ncbi:MAG: universal stress protein [Oscillatoriales cyanobacterium RU_3_3]|nr:universal stress protein [Oscillatoriales cyanobacterium RU_3_3]
MLARFESALGCQGLAEEMVLLPEPKTRISRKSESAKSVNLIVGYSGSANSQIALDITLWIAHQTRLVTTQEVTVPSRLTSSMILAILREIIGSIGQTAMSDLDAAPIFNCAAPAMALLAEKQQVSQRANWLDRPYLQAIFGRNNEYEIADKVLWEARCLAEEWRGLLKAHLRIGRVAAEMRKVVELETANVLFLGCSSASDSLICELGNNFPCCALGIPSRLTYSMDFQPEVGSNKRHLATAK